MEPRTAPSMVTLAEETRWRTSFTVRKQRGAEKSQRPKLQTLKKNSEKTACCVSQTMG
jgi:hypothetical protein